MPALWRAGEARDGVSVPGQKESKRDLMLLKPTWPLYILCIPIPPHPTARHAISVRSCRERERGREREGEREREREGGRESDRGREIERFDAVESYLAAMYSTPPGQRLGFISACATQGRKHACMHAF